MKKPKVESMSILEGTAVANQHEAGANTPNGGVHFLGAFLSEAGWPAQPGILEQIQPRLVTHILCRVSVFPLNITDRTVTSSRL